MNAKYTVIATLLATIAITAHAEQNGGPVGLFRQVQKSPNNNNADGEFTPAPIPAAANKIVGPQPMNAQQADPAAPVLPYVPLLESSRPGATDYKFCGFITESVNNSINPTPSKKEFVADVAKIIDAANMKAGLKPNAHRLSDLIVFTVPHKAGLQNNLSEQTEQIFYSLSNRKFYAAVIRDQLPKIQVLEWATPSDKYQGNEVFNDQDDTHSRLNGLAAAEPTLAKMAANDMPVDASTIGCGNEAWVMKRFSDPAVAAQAAPAQNAPAQAQSAAAQSSGPLDFVKKFFAGKDDKK